MADVLGEGGSCEQEGGEGGDEFYRFCPPRLIASYATVVSGLHAMV